MSNENAHTITIREALLSDIPQMHIIRMSVHENKLNNPALVTHNDYVMYLTSKGKGWVSESAGTICGFAIINIENHNVWALFVHPEFEGMGMGKRLHQQMLDYYFSQTKETIWLSTAIGSRAETFYKLNGWKEAGLYNQEQKFEMSFEDWKMVNNEQ